MKLFTSQSKDGEDSPKIKLMSSEGFSLIELLISFVVAMVGAFSVMGLLSVGLNQTQSSIDKSYSMLTGEQILKITSVKVSQGDWGWLEDVFATEKYGSDEPESDQWNHDEPLVEGNNFRLLADENGTPGILLFQSFFNDDVDFQAVVRLSRESTYLPDGSQIIKLNAEVSSPVEIPYTSRNKVNFTKEVFKQAYLSIDTAEIIGCAVTRYHANGFSSTLSSVVENTLDDTYTVSFDISSNGSGCGDDSCEELTQYIVGESYSSEITFSGSGVGSANAESAIAGSDVIDGFKLVGIEGISGDAPASFNLTFTVPSLDSQKINARSGTTNNSIVTFAEGDFQYVLACSELVTPVEEVPPVEVTPVVPVAEVPPVEEMPADAPEDPFNDPFNDGGSFLFGY